MASAVVQLNSAAFGAISADGHVAKGNVLTVAQLAGDDLAVITAVYGHSILLGQALRAPGSCQGTNVVVNLFVVFVPAEHAQLQDVAVRHSGTVCTA